MIKITKRPCHEVAGSLNRFLVPSDTVGVDPYICDLEDLNGNGSCTCPHFGFKSAEAEEASNRGDHFLRCKHLVSAFNWKAMQAVMKDSNGMEKGSVAGRISADK